MNHHLFLNAVQRPARYVAGEFNQKPIKPAATVKWCFAFPDVYEIGMSFTGISLLYGLLNEDPRSSCERVFAPWIDAEARLAALGEPLCSLESGTPLHHFDVIGFTLQHEMNYSNVLTILNSGGIPLFRKDRDRTHPLLIAGGSCTYNPEPVADFFDAFVIGDGEEVVLEINQLLAECPVHQTERETLLRELARIPGIYVPSLYEVQYHPDGTIRGIQPVSPGFPFPVQARKVRLAGAYFNSSPLVTSTEVIHDRAAIEVLRGCTRGCRFCQAGYISRPIRERSGEEIIRISREMMKTTGQDNLSLLSLSTADHKNLPGIIDGLLTDWDRSIGISLPSLRIDGFDLRVATRLAELHQSGFTFAPEAGTTRLRKAISKDLGEREIMATLEGVFQRGWQTIKLYFQIGLPTETMDDLDGMADLVCRFRDLLVRKVRKRPKLNVSVNPHVPKPFTPFQWFGQDDLPTLKEKTRYLKRIFPRGPVSLSCHEPELSVLEGVMARGDRKVSQAILRAWQLGCRFDDWRETFQYSRWLQAFEETGIDPGFYNQRERGEDEIFPWEAISCGVEREYFWLEWNRALKNKATYDCRDRRSCTLCGICTEDYRHDLYPPSFHTEGPSLVDLVRSHPDKKESTPHLCSPVPQETPEAPDELLDTPPGSEQRRTIRLCFSKKGVSRWLGQIDLQKTLIQTFRRAELPLATSQGFNPRPILSFAMALPVGVECSGEWVDVTLCTDDEMESLPLDSLIERLNAVSAPGIAFQSGEWIPPDAPSLARQASRLEGTVRWLDGTPDPEGIFATLSEGVMEFRKSGRLVSLRPAREEKPAREVDLAPFIESLELEKQDGLPLFRVSLRILGGRTIRADEVVHALAHPHHLDPAPMDVRRGCVELGEQIAISRA